MYYHVYVHVDVQVHVHVHVHEHVHVHVHVHTSGTRREGQLEHVRQLPKAGRALSLVWHWLGRAGGRIVRRLGAAL